MYREQHTQYNKGAGSVTTHRMIWIGDDYPRTAVALFHTAVNAVDPHVC